MGKTSLLVRYVDNKFSLATKSTIGADFLSKQIEVDDQAVTLQVEISFFVLFCPFYFFFIDLLISVSHWNRFGILLDRKDSKGLELLSTEVPMV